jgi:hypothetical protein
MRVINDDSSVIIKWSFKLIDTARGVIYNRHMFIVQATDLWPSVIHNGLFSFIIVAQWQKAQLIILRSSVQILPLALDERKQGNISWAVDVLILLQQTGIREIRVEPANSVKSLTVWLFYSGVPFTPNAILGRSGLEVSGSFKQWNNTKR